MAEDNIDDILVRLDEIEKLQAELRHLVPRAANISSRLARHQDLSRDSSSSIRFPSLFTFPAVSNFTTSPRNERVQKSAGQLNLSEKLSSNYRPSTVNLKNAGKSSKGRSSVKELDLFRDILGSTNNVAKSYGRDALPSNAPTSALNSKKSTPTSHRAAKGLQGVIEKGLKNKASRSTAGDKTHCAIGERSNIRLPKYKNNADSIPSSVQTSDSQAYVEKTAKSRGIRSCLRGNGYRVRNGISKGTFVERIMKKLNYCFVNDERVTVSRHHPGTRAPRRVRVSRAPTFEGPETLQVRVSAAKISV